MQHVIVEGAAENKFTAIAADTGIVAAKAAIGRLAASMLDTAMTSSITNIIIVFDTTSMPAGSSATAARRSRRPHRSSRSANRARWCVCSALIRAGSLISAMTPSSVVRASSHGSA